MSTWTGTPALPAFASGDIPGGDGWAAVLAALSAMSDATTSYTPTWTCAGTAPALGNGTLTGNYLQVNKFVAVRIVWTAGSTTTFGTSFYRFTLPVTPFADQLLGALLNDSSASNRWAGQCWITTAATSGDNMRIVFSGTAAFAGLTNALPVTLATSDKLILQGVYEAA